MTEYSGKCIAGADMSVTGRLCAVGASARVSGTEAKILLWDGISELGDAALCGAVGVVLLSHCDSQSTKRAEQTAGACRLPMLSVDAEVSAVPPSDNIAILDCKAERLYVDPDIETVKSHLGTKQEQSTETLLYLPYEAHAANADCDGLYVDCGVLGATDEQMLFERLCDIADGNTGARLAAMLSWGGRVPPMQGIRAVYRAGVWGRFSLILTGLDTPENASRAIEALHCAFCELECEGREFNGFIPKGINIQSPLLLLEPPKHRPLDFFCMDIPMLCRRFGGEVRHLEKYIAALIKGCGELTLSAVLDCVEGVQIPEVLSGSGVLKEIYAQKRNMQNIRRQI